MMPAVAGQYLECRRPLCVGLCVEAKRRESVVVDARHRDVAERPRDESSEVSRLDAIGIHRLGHHACGCVGVESLVHPRVLELVGGHHRVPPLMPNLVGGCALRKLCGVRREPARSTGDERRVLHPVAVTLKRGIDDRDVAVRIGAEPLAVVLQRGCGRVEVAVRLSAMLGEKSSRMSTGGSVGCSNRRVEVEKVRARGPGEVVDVVLLIAMGRGAVRIVRSRRLATPVAPTTNRRGTVRRTS